MATLRKTARRKAKRPTEVTFDYIKSNFFRVIHADGAFGGLAPNGNIHMALYNERQAIPKQMAYTLDGVRLGPEIKEKRQGREGLVREVEVDVILSLEQARSLGTWLTDKVEALEDLGNLLVTAQPVPAKPKAIAKSKARAKPKATTKPKARAKSKPRKLNGGSRRGVSKK